MRAALALVAQEGCSQRDAARRAGVHEVTFSKALRKPHVAAELDRMKQGVAEAIGAMKGHFRTLALEHAWYLAKNAKSEAVQARMVELLAGETRATPLVQFNISPGGGGYEYLPPGSQLVDITPAGRGEGEAIHADDEGEPDQ